jgi:hypothetical protein
MLYNMLRRMIWVGHVACMRERRGMYRVFAGKPEGKRPPGRHRHRWEDNIKMNLQEVRCGGMVMNLRVPLNAGNFLTSCKLVSFSRRTLFHGVSK